MIKTRARKLARHVTSSSVAWGGAMTLLRGIGFLVVMAYALRKIPTAEIGLWDVMLSIAGLGAIVEFGFAATISRYASYYSGGAVNIAALGTNQFGSGGMNTGALASLVQMAGRLYGLFGLLVGVLMLVVWVGWQLWGDSPAQGVGPRESAAFGLLVVGTAFNMTGMYWAAILYGMNRVHLFNQSMVAGLVGNYALALIGLIAGAGILALVAGQIVGSLIPRLVARRVVKAQLSGVAASETVPMSWRELWPTTWRAGILTFCTYLMIGTTTVFCYIFSDIHTAASYGLTMQMALMLHTTSTLWVWVKIPAISVMRAQGDWKGIVGLLRWRLPASLLTYALGAAVTVLVAPWVLSLLQSKTQVLPRPEMLALLILIGLDLIVGHHSALLQTGNEVPHMTAFCLSAALTLLLVWPLGTRFQVWGVIGAPFLAQLVVNYWWVPYQFWERLGAGLRGAEGRHVSSEGTRTTKVIIDGWLLRQGGHGLANFARMLVDGLAKSDRRERLLVAVPAGSEHAVPEGLEVLSLSNRKTPTAALGEAWWQDWLGRHVRDHLDEHVLLAPSPFLSSAKVKRSIVVCHDLIPIQFPRYLGRFLYRRWLFNGRLRWLADATRVVTDSEFTARELREHLGDSAPPIDSIPLWTPLTDAPCPSPAARQAIQAKYRLPERYWLYLGGYDYRKNVELLIEAYGRVAASGECPALVLAGDIPADLRKPVCDIPAALRTAGLADGRVYCPGYIQPDDLAAMYAGAELFIYPSLSEGFGLPPIEAMSCGCPAIVADTTSLPEVVTDSNYRFSVHDAAQLTEMLTSAARAPMALNPGFDRNQFREARGLREYLQLIDRVLA